MFKIELYLNRLIKCGLYAILFTPLFFWPGALYGFMTPRFILFQILVEIVFAAWLILAVSNPQYRPKFSWLLAAVVAFTGISLVSALFGVDFQRSIWGIGARMTGLFAELHFLAWFLVLASSLNNANNENQYANDANREYNKKRLAISGISNKFLNWHYYLNFSFAVSVLVALSAFYQNTDWRLVYGSTFFNNPTFAAPYFLFHFFWGLYQTLISPFWKKWFFGISVALLAFAVFLGEVRGAIAGFFVGLIILGLGLILTDATSRRFKILISTFFIVVFIGISGLWFARNLAFVQNTSVLKRLTQVSLNQTTVQTRLIVWRLAILANAVFNKQIWLGAGPENFNYVFNSNYNPALLKYGLGETWFDKPHNAYLEVLTEAGIVGAAVYLFVLVAIAWALHKLRKTDKKFLSVFLASAFFSYFVALFSSFDSFGSWFGLFLFLAFLASHNNANQNPELRMPRIVNLYSQLVSFAIIFVALALIYVNYGIWQANIADADALRVFSKSPAQGIELFKKSLSYNSPYKSEYQFDLFASVTGALAKNLQIPQLEDNLNFALSGAYEAVKSHPQNAAYYTDMARLYNILGEKGKNSEILNQAEVFGKKSLELSPNRQETRFYLARTALLKNDTKLAVKLTKKAEELDPSVNLSHWYFGLALIADNQSEAGKIEIKKALELGFRPQNDTEKAFIKNLGL